MFKILAIFFLIIRSSLAVSAAPIVNAFADNFRTGLYNVDTSRTFNPNPAIISFFPALHSYTTGYSKTLSTAPRKVVLGIKNYYQLMPTKRIDVIVKADYPAVSTESFAAFSFFTSNMDNKIKKLTISYLACYTSILNGAFNVGSWRITSVSTMTSASPYTYTLPANSFATVTGGDDVSFISLS